jgi:hypothetical protein
MFNERDATVYAISEAITHLIEDRKMTIYYYMVIQLDDKLKTVDKSFTLTAESHFSISIHWRNAYEWAQVITAHCEAVNMHE